MPSLGDELLTNARLVDGGAKVIIIIIIIVIIIIIMSISCFDVLTIVLQVPFLSAAVWRDGETLEEELMEAVMTDKVTTIMVIVDCENHLQLSRHPSKSWRLMPDLGSTWHSPLRLTLGRAQAKDQEEVGRRGRGEMGREMVRGGRR